VMYVMGGYDEDVTTLKTAERYDPKTDRWSPIAEMNVERFRASATALNGKVYVVGGLRYGKLVRSAEVYDPRTSRWSLGRVSPVPNRQQSDCLWPTRLAP
jgi:hypothetical protein